MRSRINKPPKTNFSKNSTRETFPQDIINNINNINISYVIIMVKEILEE